MFNTNNNKRVGSSVEVRLLPPTNDMDGHFIVCVWCWCWFGFWWQRTADTVTVEDTCGQNEDKMRTARAKKGITLSHQFRSIYFFGVLVQEMD